MEPKEGVAMVQLIVGVKGEGKTKKILDRSEERRVGKECG